jgi:urease beta subunit
MIHQERCKRFVLAASCFVGLLGGCAVTMPPAMAPASELPAPAAGQGSVVFVQPETPCDGLGFSVVVDDHGRFVGNVASGTRVAVAVRPGTHVFYSWSVLDLRFERDQNINMSAATRVRVGPSETKYVGIGPLLGRRQCLDLPVMEMTELTPAQVDGALQATQPVVADRAAGQADLDSKPFLLRTNLELGRWKLERLDDIKAHEIRRASLVAEGDL